MKTVAGIEAERTAGKAQVFGKSVDLGELRLEDTAEKDLPTIRTVIPFELKSLDDTTRTIEFVGSTKAIDRMGDSIEQAGWELGNFVKNPVVPWGHDYSMPPVAKALEVRLVDGALTFKAQFATKDEYEWADTIYKLYKGGYLRAFSVGFIPKEYDGDWTTGYTFTKCELLEVSCVTVPANPEALTLAFGDGSFTESERRTMIGNATKLIKALTVEDNEADNGDMETAKAISELAEQVKALTALLTKDAETPAEPVVEESEVAEPVVEEEPEAEAGDNSEDKPSEGTQEADNGAESEDVLKSITAEDVRTAVRGAIRSEIDYKLGKID